MLSVHNIQILASITNAGLEPVKLLTYGTILDGNLPTSLFVVTKDGKAVSFTGVRVCIHLRSGTPTQHSYCSVGHFVSSVNRC